MLSHAQLGSYSERCMKSNSEKNAFIRHWENYNVELSAPVYKLQTLNTEFCHLHHCFHKRTETFQPKLLFPTLGFLGQCI